MTYSTAFGDELLAKRYRLLRLIAQGGMGEVYEALDETLGQRVAVKMVRAEVAQTPGALERFKREINLARRITHPNVSRIFDIGTHMSPLLGSEVTFLTMELLEGPTLEEHLQAKGKLEPDEALPIVRQMAEGLAAAHDVGIVHRDLKSSNVMLVPAGAELRVVVTDFGLARGLTGEDRRSLALTATDMVVGTPAYMAPEQAEGHAVTAQSDIYSLGVVLFEMLTGSWPHTGATPMAMLLKRLKSPPPSPRTLVPSIDGVWERVIMKCLELKPEDRFRNVRDVVRALTDPSSLERLVPVAAAERAPRGVPASSSPFATTPQTPVVSPAASSGGSSFATSSAGAGGSGAKRLLAVSIGLVALVAAGLGVRALLGPRRTGDPAASPDAVKVRRAVAVLGFKNLSGRREAAWLSTAFAEMLTAELAAGEKLRTIAGENVARMKLELALADADSLAADTLAKIRSNVGADLVVLGSYLAVPDASGQKVRFVLRLQDATLGETLATLQEDGSDAEILTLVSRMGEKVRERLGAGAVTAAAVHRAQAAVSRNPEALRLYSEGLARLRAYELVEARDGFTKALAADPNHPQLHGALAEAWSALGYDRKAEEAAQRAFDLSGELSREDRLFIEGRLREIQKNWAKATEIYRTLYGFFPDNVDYGLRLARAETRGGRPADAAKTIALLAKLPEPASSDVRLDLAEAEAAESLGDFKRQLAAATRAAERGAARGSVLLTARARLHESSALLRLGEHARASAACEISRRLFQEAGDKNGEADSLHRLGRIALEEGRQDESQRFLNQALDTWRGLGQKWGEVTGVLSLASSKAILGDLAAAKPLFHEALRLSREVGDRSREALALANLGEVSHRQGDLAAARAFVEQSAATARETGDRYALIAALLMAGHTALGGGRVDEARARYEEGLAFAREIGDRRVTAFLLFGLGNAMLALDDPARAEELQREALTLRQQLQGRSEIAESRLALGLVFLETGRSREALAELSSAREVFRALGMSTEETQATAALAVAALPDLAAAKAEDEKTAALVRRCQSLPARLFAEAARCRVLTATSRADEAERLAREVVAEAVKKGLLREEGEARLALARAQRAAGRAGAADETLRGLASFAAERHLPRLAALVAREAQRGN